MFPRSFRLPWERNLGPPQPPHNSYVHTIEPVQVSDMNFHGTLYGGKLMRWLETNAHLSARAYVGGKPVQMVGLHGLTFIRPVQRHVFVHIHSVVVHAEPAGPPAHAARPRLTSGVLDPRGRARFLTCAGRVSAEESMRPTGPHP